MLLERIFISEVEVEEVLELLSALLLVELLKSIVLVVAISDVVTALFGDVVDAPLLSFVESSQNEKDAIHSPVIIGSSLKPHISSSSYSDR